MQNWSHQTCFAFHYNDCGMELENRGNRTFIKPVKSDWELAGRIHSEFHGKPESLHIALEHALAHLSASLRLQQPKSVLELGAGIGTITKLLLQMENRPTRIVATEDHPVCLEAISDNLAGVDVSGLSVVTNIDDLLALSDSYDFVICDGGFLDQRVFRGVEENALCFFEGSRGPQRRLLNSCLEEKGLICELENYYRIGWHIFMKEPGTPEGLHWRRPKLKRRKGCWIGPVVRVNE